MHFLFAKSLIYNFAKFNVDDPSVCVFLASHSSEIVEVVIIQLGTVTASDMGMHHMLIILTLTFIQSHTDLNHENKKCLIFSETDDLDLHSKPLKLNYFVTCSILDNI